MRLASLPIARHHYRKHLLRLPNLPRHRLRNLNRLLAQSRSPPLLLRGPVGVVYPPLRPSSVHRPGRRAPYPLFLKRLAVKSDAERIFLARKLFGEIASLAEERKVRVRGVGRASTGALFLGVGQQRVLVVVAGQAWGRDEGAEGDAVGARGLRGRNGAGGSGLADCSPLWVGWLVGWLGGGAVNEILADMGGVRLWNGTSDRREHAAV